MPQSTVRIFLNASLWLGCAWLLYHSVDFTLVNEPQGTSIFRDCFRIGTVANAVLFFGFLYLFPRSHHRGSRRFLSHVLILTATVTLLEILANRMALTAIGIPPASTLFLQLAGVILAGNLAILSLGILVSLVIDRFHQHRLAQEIQIKQVQTELDLLKNRIHPHFLFNVLNSIFFLAQKNDDPETADAIARLSQMMRYMLQDVACQWVPVAEELAYLENYVAMQRLRWTSAIPIEFDVLGDFAAHTIPPMMFLPFVENAFKHGISNARLTPIRIRVHLQDASISLLVENHIHTSQAPGPGGFGLANARRRLNLLYPAKHVLKITANENLHRVELTLASEQARVESPLHAAVAVENPV